ncbi:trypsin-like serine protease [Kocuria sp. CPCC 205258]|uniref:serine protease n=1 Tax=Kocuria sp. CPCC 205258 TaxID=3073552 RepID=UPI0034D552A6
MTMSTTPDSDTPDRRLTQFVGDRDAPVPLDEVYRRPPVPASAPPPEELARMRSNRTLYVPNQPGSDNRALQPSPAGPDGPEGYMQLEVPVEGEFPLGALPGRAALRESPQEIVESTDPTVSYSSYRPEWQDVSYTPRPLPGNGEPPAMRRINGRPVRPLYVFPPEDRQQYRDNAWPWGLVGRITTSGGWSGSGALVGDRTVITAGHVVPWGQSSWWMKFTPAYYDGQSLHGPGVESYVSDTRGFDTAGDVTGYDWAVLRLYQPLGKSLGYFGYNGYSGDWQGKPYWTLLGYPGAIANGQRPSYQSASSVFDDDSDSNGGQELETRADATPGNSGGPYFGWWGQDARVIGVVSGQEEDYIFPFGSEKGNVMAAGSGFTNLIAWARTNWPL